MSQLRLKDVCTKIGSGATPRGGGEVYIDRGVALIRSQNVYNDGFHWEGLAYISDAHAAELEGVEVRPGDVLLNITGDSVARACIAPADVLPARVNQHVAIIRPDPERLDPRYLHYHLVSPTKQREMLAFASAGATRNALTKGLIEDFVVPAPSILEQRAIAATLGSLDEKIEQNRRTARALERLARAIFRAWFVDFEPVKAKARGARRFPSMPQSAYDTLPTRFVDSDLGPIPAGWGVAPLSRVAGINERSIGKDYPHRAIQYIDISCVAEGRLASPTHYDLADAPSRAQRLVRHGDTIWSCVRPNRRSYLFMYRPAADVVVSTGFAVLSPKSVPTSYLYEFVTTDAFVEYLTANATGSAYPAVRADHFGRAACLVPTAEVLESFEAVVGPLREWIGAAQTENRALAALRDLLLPTLLSGEVRVA